MATTIIAIAGITGRMGSSIVRAAFDDESVKIGCATARPKSDLIGSDIGLVAGMKAQGVTIVDELNNEFDVLIDFTSPEHTLSNLNFCINERKSLIIGTTGFDADGLSAIEEAAKSIPIVLASNTSTGVSVLLKLASLATKAMRYDADIEVIEAHHRHKVDAPSGTALSIGETIAEAMDCTLEEVATFSRHGMNGPRNDAEIGFSVVRGGDVVGEHTICFYMEGERVELSHKATDRMIFARGALRAAKWLNAQSAGFYSMSDVLGI